MKNVSEFNIEHPSDSDGAAYGIDGSIDRLHRLAVRIRQSSKEGLPERVRAFAKKNTSDGSEKMISEIIKYKYQHPLISERLLAHLTKTVIYRHHRLRYIQRHQGKLAEDRDHKTGGHTDQARNTGRGKGSETKPPIGATEASLEEPYSETSPSTMNTKVYNQQDNVKQAKPSTVAGSISSSWIGKISYPPPPANKDKSSHLICPYCFQEFQAKVLETTLSWRYNNTLPHCPLYIRRD
jgi:hypothetical protein